MHFNIANTFTYARFFITPVMIYFFFDNALIAHRVWSMLVVIVLFILGSLTDYWDGYFARKHRLTSRYGEFLDPLADKFFTLGIFISFAFIPHMFMLNIFLFLIVIREFFITTIRVVFLAKNKYMRTEKHGKIKTTVQITVQICILALLLHHAILFEMEKFQGFLISHGLNKPGQMSESLIIPCYQFFSYPKWFAEMLYWLPNVLLAIAAYVTVQSGISYLRSNWGLIRSELWDGGQG